MRTRSMVVCLVLSIVMLAAFSATVLAKSSNGTETIASGQYASEKVDYSSGILFTVTYSVTVTSGPKIDVFFVDSSNFQKYKDHLTFNFVMEDLNVSSASRTTFLSATGMYYLVLDNTNTGTPLPTNPPIPTATVQWSVDTPGSDVTNAAGIVGLAIGVCIAVIIVWFIIWILIAVWVYRDAERRGASGVLWLIVVILLGLIGLIIYLIVRPKEPVAPQGYMPPPGYAPPPGYQQPPPGYQPPPPGWQPPPPQAPPAPPQQ
jgi:hypothetical protein